MTKKGKEMESVSARIERLISEVEAADKVAIKSRNRKYSDVARSYKRWVGLEKNNGNFGRFSARTILKYLSSARKALRTSDLMASDATEQLTKLSKALPKYSKEIDAIKASKNQKQAWRKAINNRDNSEGLRKALKKLTIEHPVHYRLLASKGADSALADIKTEKADLDRGAVVSKNKGESQKSVRISLPAIKRAVKEGLEPSQTHASRIALALILCTGRRTIELVKVGSFEKVDSKTLRFTGQAKKKYGEIGNSYEIPVLFTTADKVLKAFDRLRKHETISKLQKMENEKVNAVVSGTVNDCARSRLFEDNAVFYNCRSIYAHIAYDEYKANVEAMRKEGKETGTPLSKTGHTSSLLGHGDDLSSAMSYEGVNIDEHYTIAQAQEHYKKQVEDKKKVVAKTDSTKKHKSLPALKRLRKKLPEMIENGRSLKSRLELVDWIIGACEINGDFGLTATNIRKKKGGRMQPISDTLADLANV